MAVHVRTASFRDKLQLQPFFWRNDVVTRETYVHVHVCLILYMWRPAGRKTLVETLTNDNYVPGKLSPIFWIVVFRRERYQIKDSVRLDAEALNEDLCPAACARICGQPSLFGDDTHAVATRPNCGWKAWHTDRCSTQGRGQA